MSSGGNTGGGAGAGNTDISILPEATSITGREFVRVLGEDSNYYKAREQTVVGSVNRQEVTKKAIMFCGGLDTNTVKTDIVRLEKYPFDGLVMNMLVDFPEPFYGTTPPFKWQFHTLGGSTVPVDRNTLATSISEYKTTKFSKFHCNFNRINLCSAGLDATGNVSLPSVYDVFNPEQMFAVIYNHQSAAWSAKEAGMYGVMWDLENYNVSRVMNPAYKLTSKTIVQYRAQWKKIGGRFMNAFQDAFPDIQLAITLGYTQMQGQNQGDIDGDNNYGFLKDLLAGVYDACRGTARVIMMDELSYEHQADVDFDYDINLQNNYASVPFLESKNYPRVKVAGLGTWLDSNHSGAQPFDHVTPTNNYHTPNIFKNNCKEIWERCDWLWVYSNSKWNGATPGSNDIPLGPSGYDTALRNARIDAGIEVAFDIKQFKDILFYWDPTQSGGSNGIYNTLTDQSGQGNNLSGSGSPTFSTTALGTGMPGIVLASASSQYYSSAALGAALSGDKPITFIFQLKTSSNNFPTAQTVFSAARSDSATPYRYAHILASGGRWSFNGKGDTGSNNQQNSTTFSNGSPSSNTNHIFTIRNSSGETNNRVHLRINGTEVLTWTNQPYTTAPTLNIATLGALNTNGAQSNFYDGAIGCIAILARCLQDQEILAIERQMARVNSALVTTTSVL